MIRAVSVWVCRASAVTSIPSIGARRNKTWAAGISWDLRVTNSDPSQRPPFTV
jgi:hypothetical protein